MLRAARPSKGPIIAVGVLGLALVVAVVALVSGGGSTKRPPPPPVAQPVTPDAAVIVAVAPVVTDVAPAAEPDAGLARSPAPGPPGLLTVDATPWGTVSLDGRPIGETPLANVKGPAGSHQLLVRNPDTGRVERRTVKIESGRATALKVDLR